MPKSEVCRSWGWTSTLAWGERDPVKKSKNHVWESNSGTDRSWRGTTCKACSESQTVLRSQQCTRNLAVRTSHHEALRARWTTWSDLLESVTLLKTVVYFGNQGASCRSFQQGFHETSYQSCRPCATHGSLRDERHSHRQHSLGTNGICKRSQIAC